MLKERSFIKRSGISLIEVILAAATFMIVAVVFTGGIISSQEATLRASTRARALVVANEGLEAMRNIRDGGYANLIDGSYGLILQNNQWSMSGTSGTTDIFSRTITISSVDTDTKLIKSDVTWSGSVANSGAVSLNTYLTNWHDIAAAGGGGGGGGQAGSATVSSGGAYLSPSGRSLRGLSMDNAGSSDITLIKMTVSWTNAASRIQSVRLANKTVWAANGAGHPSGNQTSGTELDIKDVKINDNQGSDQDNEGDGAVGINSIRFTQSMVGSHFTFVLTFKDGSQKTFTVF